MRAGSALQSGVPVPVQGLLPRELEQLPRQARLLPPGLVSVQLQLAQVSPLGLLPQGQGWRMLPAGFSR